jgi:SH3-like domain-containing protein
MMRAAIFLSALLALGPAAAQAPGASGLPVPRFVSLKSDRVNVRQGPSRDHAVVWTFTRAGLPVEITAEFETWRRIRDQEGSEGWVQQGLLSGRRTAVVAPWRRGQSVDLRTRPGGGEVAARVESGVLAVVRSCTGQTCRVVVENGASSVAGHIEQAALWGVYPNEVFD